MPSRSTSTDIIAAAALVSAGAGLTILIQKTLLKYKPDKIWKFVLQSGGLNRPTAGARTTKDLPKGKHALQLHSLATPNGVKVTSLLEELVIKYGPEKVDYDAYTANILKGDQFTSGFVSANPNSKIPVLLHFKNGIDKPPVRIFESAAIMIYLCEQFDNTHEFLPAKDDPIYPECLSWLFWVQGSAPFLGGGFGHFYSYAPIKIKYAIDRYSMEAKRQLDVLDKHLGGALGGEFSGGPYLCGKKFTVADIAIWAWYGTVMRGKIYDAAEFLQVDQYKNLKEWTELVGERQGMIRGRLVNRTWGPEEEQLPERHSVDDFKKFEEAKKVNENK